MKLTILNTSSNNIPRLEGVNEKGDLLTFYMESDTDIRPLVDWQQHKQPFDWPYVSPMKADLREAFAEAIGEEIPDDAVIGVQKMLGGLLLKEVGHFLPKEERKAMEEEAKRVTFKVAWFRSEG